MAGAVTVRRVPQPATVVDAAAADSAATAAGTARPAVIATVNGQPIPYRAWINLLKRSHGLSAFQQLLAVEIARQAAEAKGIHLGQADLDEAYDKDVQDLVGPGTEPNEAQRILKAVLARRGVSEEEFRLSAYRNAYLRRIAEPIVEAGITDDAMEIEFDRLYGPKVQVRHIQVSDSESLTRVNQALANGDDFAEIAQRYSQNIDTTAGGGLLAPFSRLDPSVPAALREVAFRLERGEVSGPVRVDGWSQILRLERKFPAEPVEMADVADKVRESLKTHLVRQQMQELLRSMLESASLQIHEPDLAKRFGAIRAANRAQ